jgi:hypothetical protein
LRFSRQARQVQGIILANTVPKERGGDFAGNSAVWQNYGLPKWQPANKFGFHFAIFGKIPSNMANMERFLT